MGSRGASLGALGRAADTEARASALEQEAEGLRVRLQEAEEEREALRAQLQGEAEERERQAAGRPLPRAGASQWGLCWTVRREETGGGAEGSGRLVSFGR